MLDERKGAVMLSKLFQKLIKTWRTVGISCHTHSQHLSPSVSPKTIPLQELVGLSSGLNIYRNHSLLGRLQERLTAWSFIGTARLVFVFCFSTAVQELPDLQVDVSILIVLLLIAMSIPSTTK